MREVDLVVVGGGPAGLAAARSAASRGIQTVLVDNHPMSEDASFEVLGSHSVWGAFPTDAGTIVGVFDSKATSLLRARHLILATGAIDLPLAFPGATLPGVVSALDMLAQGHLTARRIVIVGSGALAQAVANRAREINVDVARHVDWREGWTIGRAEGDDAVQRVVLARVDDVSHEVSITADAVCVAVGRQPAIELAALAGCPIDFDPARGGHFARPTPTVSLAGDLAGATDAAFATPAVAEESGLAAADRAARSLGQSDGTVGDDDAPGMAFSEAAYATDWHRLADMVSSDNTVMCACESVTRADVVAAIRASDASPDEVKRLSRAGMGTCQGRQCRVTIAGLIASRTGRTFGEVPVTAFRPPVRPLPMAALATADDA